MTLSTDLLFRKEPVLKMLLFLEESTFMHTTMIDDLILQKIEIQIYIKTEQISIEMKRYVQDTFPTHGLSTFSMMDVSNILSQQRIGTHLFICGKWSMIQAIKEKAYNVGFTESEIQTMGIGPKEEKVFCVKCYSYNLMKKENNILCEHCNTLLNVSNHFSKRLNAYLGYIHI